MPKFKSKEDALRWAEESVHQDIDTGEFIIEGLSDDGQKLRDEITASKKYRLRSQEAEATIKTLQTQLDALNGEYAAFRQSANRATILSELRKNAIALRIPNGIVDFELPRYVDDFQLADDGKIHLRNEPEMSVEKTLTKLQQERSHWKPVSIGAGAVGGGTNFCFNNNTLGSRLTAGQ